MGEAAMTDREKTDKSFYGSYASRVRGREVTAQSNDGSQTRRKGGAAMKSTATELEFTRRRAMKATVKVFVIGALGLAVLFGSSAVSLAAPLKPGFDPARDCTQITVDTWRCVVDGKVVTCNPGNPKGPCYGLKPQGGTSGPKLPVTTQPPAGGAIQR